jgi:predicted SprT family Zn-dependent metalloprotease
MKENSLTPILTMLEESHAHFNKTLFASALENRPLITLNPKGHKKNTLGWYAHEKWANGKENLPELNLCAEDLRRKPAEVLETLIHEMTHQLAHQLKVKDCSRNGTYHNKKFRDLALGAGLECLEPTKRNGYGLTKLGTKGMKSVESILSKVTPVLVLARSLIVKKPSKGKMLLYQCDCGYKIRSGRRDLQALCHHCQTDFELQN